MLAAMVNGDCASLQGIASCQVRHWRRVVAAVHFLSHAGRPAALLRASSPGPHCAVHDPLQRLHRVSRPPMSGGVRQPNRNSRRRPRRRLRARAASASSTRRARAATDALSSCCARHGSTRPPRCVPLRACAVHNQRRRRRVAPSAGRGAIRHCELVAAGRIGAVLFVTWSIHPCSRRLRCSRKRLSGKPGRRSRYVRRPTRVCGPSIHPAGRWACPIHTYIHIYIYIYIYRHIYIYTYIYI
jgi:hypothetical protein